MYVDVSKPVVLGLYRKLLKTANLLPFSSQRNFVLQKARREFRLPRADHDALVLSVRLAHTHIDDIAAQAESRKKLVCSNPS